MQPEGLLQRRIFIALGLAAIPMVTGGSAAEEGEGGKDTGFYVHCVEPTDHACPAEETLIGDPLDSSCEVASVHSDAVYGDGECCYEVTRRCEAIGCACAHGRPLQVSGRHVTAGMRRGGTWWDRRVPVADLTGLDAGRRARLAHFWASVGVHEHASVASFQRAALELLAHGAPAGTVASVVRAAADEVRHARYAFTLASRFAGAPIAPGPVPLSSGVAIAGTLSELAARTAVEGCVEETRSVAAACAMLSGATDPAARWVLERIVRDEIRHAALAWKTLRWAVDVGGAEVRSAVRAAFADWRPTEEADAAPPHPSLAAWGCVSDARLLRAATAIQRSTIGPAAERLLAA